MPDPADVQNANPSLTVAAIPARPKRRRWLKRGFYFLLLMGIAGWFAPTIVGKTALRDRVPKLLFPNFPGDIEIGETSLGWTSPVVIKNLNAKDEDGHALFEVGQLSSSETLWTLATRAGNLGTLTLLAPVIHVSMRDGGSNIERVLTKLLSGPPTEKPSADVVVEIANAKLELEHPEKNRQSTIDRVSVRLISTGGGVDEFDLAIGNPPTSSRDANAATLEAPAPSDGDATTTGWLAVRYASNDANHLPPKTNASKSVRLRASHWKLDRFGPLLACFDTNAEFGGELSADASVILTPTVTGFDWDWNGTATIQQLLVAGFSALRRDKLTLDQVELSGRVAAIQGRLAMHDLKLVSDVGEMKATGDIPLDGHSKKSTSELAQSLLSDEDYHIDGRIDLKKLAAKLPETLRIRAGIEITAGDVNVQLVGVDVAGVRRWSCAAGIAGLGATNQGQPIHWDKPLAARINAHRENQAIVVDLVECQSEFLQVAGKGTLDDARFTASGDLSKLLQNLERFVDLGIEQLSGQMKANCELRRRDTDHVVFSSKILLDEFAYVPFKGNVKQNVWREKHLEMFVAATGRTDSKATVTNIEAGEAHLNSASDSLDLVLQQPVDLTSKSPRYAAVANLKGSLASWQNRLRSLVAFDEWKLAGTVNLATTLAVDAQQINVNQLTMDLRELEAIGPGWLIRDPEMKLQSTGRWDFKGREWTSPKTNLVGKSLTVDLVGLECAFSQLGLAKLVGTASYRADLTQLSSWKNLAIPNPSYYLIGSLSGTAGITRQDRTFIGRVDAQVEKLVVVGLGDVPSGQPQWIALWKEPQFKVSGQGSYDGTIDKLVLESTRAEVIGLSVTANGKLDDCSTKRGIDLTGDISYDWDTLLKRFGPKPGQNIQVTGKDHRPFSIKGSLANLLTGSAPSGPLAVSARPVSLGTGANPVGSHEAATSTAGAVELSGQAGLGWATANVYGFTTGAGDVSAQLDRGICRFAPLDIAVNDGKLHITPTIYLDRNAFTLVLPQEKLIDQVSLSAELCANLLRFVVPMLGDSTEVEGKFSADMHAASLPLSAPMNGTADGILLIHRAQAKSGSIALQLAGAIDQLETILMRRQPGDPNREQVWLEMPEQQVPFKLEQRRVYHNGMTFLVKNVSVRTSGSVGTDNSLSLIAEVSVRDEWLGSNKALVGLKGKSIRIPISGTTTNPQIDPSVFSNLAQQIGGSAIEGLLQDKVGGGLNEALNNGLDKLFKGRK